MEAKLNELKARWQEVDDLQAAGNLLYWDQMVGMPPGGTAARGRQLATLGRILQEKIIDPAIGRLLDELEPLVQSLPVDSDEAALVRATRLLYEREIRVPPEFRARSDEHFSAMYTAWEEASTSGSFAGVEPFLEKNLELSCEYASFFPGYAHIDDPLIDMIDPGMKVADLQPVFNELRAGLVPLIQAIAAQPAVEDGFLHQPIDRDKLLEFGRKVVQRIGYDFKRGRLDLMAHPSTIPMSLGDVRISTRFKEAGLSEPLFILIHEAGHGLYMQGPDSSYEATPLAFMPSIGMHESQSLLWESIVGHSREFWEGFYPELQALYPTQLGQVPLSAFYRAINRVQPSPKRVNSDEVTYNLHILIRFDLELDLMEGHLAVRDLPEAWNARYASDLGIHVTDDREGVLQDVQWYSGPLGGRFQSYTLGRLLSAQFYARALQDHSEIPEHMRNCEFSTLHGWLQENIYRYGGKYTASELINRITGGGLEVQPYLDYLWKKYGEIYGVSR